MKIAVIGTGYVGLVTGTCMSEMGNFVTCVDIDASKIERLNQGESIIYEQGLEPLIHRNVQQKRLFFTTDFEKTIHDSDLIFLALPTPPNEDGSADLRYVLGVAEDIGKIIKEYKIVINKSTVPVGTADKVRETIAKFYSGEFDVVSNPEFLREGMAVEDFLKPDRVVVGTRSERAKQAMKQLYEPFVRQGNPIIFMDERSSEMTKYAANAYLATRISFMNELANLCEKVGADVEVVRQGLGSDSRIGKRFLFPGLGYGGSCFPKDVSALHKTALENNYQFRILESVIEVNAFQKQYYLDSILEKFNHQVENVKFAMWGLAFKPNTDDIRDAPSLFVITELLNRGAHIACYDPEAMENVAKYFGDKWGNQLKFGEDMYSILDGSEALLIITEWAEFRSPDYALMEQKLSKKVIFDGRNLYETDAMNQKGYYYNSIGRTTVLN